MEDFKSLFVFVACEGFSGTRRTHHVFPAAAWATFSFHFFCSLNIVSDSVSALFVLLIWSPTNILVNF